MGMALNTTCSFTSSPLSAFVDSGVYGFKEPSQVMPQLSQITRSKLRFFKSQFTDLRLFWGTNLTFESGNSGVRDHTKCHVTAHQAVYSTLGGRWDLSRARQLSCRSAGSQRGITCTNNLLVSTLCGYGAPL